ncbi:MAG: crossover junction endodeoxyribonuclease RuvC [Treponema sp.]|nr:crossover junction endodeoxyribonuclease RuvC [Treponema sp.]
MRNTSQSFTQLPGSVIASPKGKVRRIIGIDPGLANTGFGIVDFENGRYRMVSYGCITTKSELSHSERLLTIYSKLQAVIQEFRPDQSCMEALFFVKNVTSGISVAEAKGVVTLCLAQNAIPVDEYKPNQIKKAVTGSANADKDLVERYVQLLLNLKEKPNPDHASDALACAICHIHTTLNP